MSFYPQSVDNYSWFADYTADFLLLQVGKVSTGGVQGLLQLSVWGCSRCQHHRRMWERGRLQKTLRHGRLIVSDIKKSAVVRDGTMCIPHTPFFAYCAYRDSNKLIPCRRRYTVSVSYSFLAHCAWMTSQSRFLIEDDTIFATHTSDFILCVLRLKKVDGFQRKHHVRASYLFLLWHAIILACTFLRNLDCVRMCRQLNDTRREGITQLFHSLVLPCEWESCK